MTGPLAKSPTARKRMNICAGLTARAGLLTGRRFWTWWALALTLAGGPFDLKGICGATNLTAGNSSTSPSGRPAFGDPSLTNILKAAIQKHELPAMAAAVVTSHGIKKF